jgi:aryl-alcohol dehydrogenase-like predicted oxidoreductase
MEYNQFGDADIEVSAIGLGGHEYFEGGVRGFNDDEFDEAVTPGVNLEGFGGEQRRSVVQTALDHGVNFFDVTIDEEKDALGRNLKTIDPDREVYVQTRPAGMVYTYEEHNESLAKYEPLKAEVERVLGLLQRDRIDVLNFGFQPEAIEHDPDFLEKVADNIERLKDEGLIRFASADTLTDEDSLLRAIETDAFDSISLGFHFANPGPADAVLPAARRRGMAVVTRAVFMKGDLFRMAEEAGIDDLDAVARASISWCLSHDGVTSVLVGGNTADEFARNLRAVETPGVTADDEAILDELRGTETYAERAE